ncbi:MAG TPA: hypothetical protein VF018_11885, partial [Acidobacteriaceae bacterium]
MSFASSGCFQNAPLANAAWSPSGKGVDGSALRRVSKSAAPTTVEDVQRILAQDKAKPDAEVARQLSGLELTERMSYSKLQSLEQRVPGPSSRLALVALADASVFLRPAAAEVLSQAPP